jgi:hypothetical protein
VKILGGNDSYAITGGLHFGNSLFQPARISYCRDIGSVTISLISESFDTEPMSSGGRDRRNSTFG